MSLQYYRQFVKPLVFKAQLNHLMVCSAEQSFVHGFLLCVIITWLTNRLHIGYIREKKKFKDYTQKSCMEFKKNTTTTDTE